MDLMKNIELLSGLCGVSGAEDEVREEILRLLEGAADDCGVDAPGNILVFKKGKKTPKKRILLSAHMDEVGFIITRVEESGLLRFAAVGGIDSRVVAGKAVEVGNRRVPGVVGVKAIHHADDKEKETPLRLEDLTIDIGAKDRAQAEAFVLPGDRAVFHAPFEAFGGDRILGRAFDDRAGCALLIDLIRSDLPFDCHFAFTVQEEIGCIGASAAAFSVDPDIAVVVEATTASDLPGVPPEKKVCRLGGGPVLSFMDKGAVYDRDLLRLALKTAEQHQIPVQVKEGVFGGNEARVLQTARDGARILAVSLPCRYLHSPSTVLEETDVSHTRDLLLRLIEAIGSL